MADTSTGDGLLAELEARGYVKQATHGPELQAYLSGDSGTPVAYVGYDATASSLHVGSLVSIMMLRHFQQAGGKPIILMGGGTTKVGDPTDKAKTRPMLSDEEIGANLASIRTVFERFLDFGDGPTGAVMVNNDDWLGGLGYLSFLRDFGRHFTVNTMIKQETVDRRLRNEQPYTFLEFNYALLQAYDFLELYRRLACRLQLGGSDQWGNITGGMELVRKVEGAECYGLTCPLITTASGAKMGKTADGAMWLNADQRSPYEYWQFWRNTEDADVGRFLRLFTELPMADIARLEALEGAAVNEAKIALANAATALLHGDAAAREAEAAAEAVFTQGAAADAMPSAAVAAADLEGGMLLAAGFVLAGLAKSNGEARRLVKQGAARVNDERVSDPSAIITAGDFSDGPLKLSAGKKRHALLTLES